MYYPSKIGEANVMKSLSYLETKKLTLEDYEDFAEDEGFNPNQVIAAAFEDSVLMIKKVIRFMYQL